MPDIDHVEGAEEVRTIADYKQDRTNEKSRHTKLSNKIYKHY